MSFEVSLLKRLVEPRLRVWDSGVASWDKLGEAGGPLYVAVRRSRGWPWKVLRLAVPLGKRIRSGVVALLILWVEATGVLWSGIVLGRQKKRHLCFQNHDMKIYKHNIPFTHNEVISHWESRPKGNLKQDLGAKRKLSGEDIKGTGQETKLKKFRDTIYAHFKDKINVGWRMTNLNFPPLLPFKLLTQRTVPKERKACMWKEQATKKFVEAHRWHKYKIPHAESKLG